MRLMSRFLRHHSSEQGQSMVELALMLVILMTMLSGVLDLGRGFFSFIAIQNAAGEGALYAAINPRCPHPSTPQCPNPNNVDYRAKYESPTGLVDPQRMDVAVSYSDGTNQYSAATISEGNPVTVTVTYRFTMIGPFSGVMPNGELIFKADAVQNILDLKKD